MGTQAADWVRWLAFWFGLVLVLVTWLSVIGTLIVPRPITSQLSRVSGKATILLFRMLTMRCREYGHRDRILAWQAPMSLFVRLALWVAMFDVGYAFLLLPFVDGRVAQAFDESGSGLFTLGYAAPARSGSAAVVLAAAFSGLIVVALQIGYLPTLYAAFNRREAEVTLLVARAGEPAWGPELLARTRFGLNTVDATSELTSIYRTWERWAADVAESHSTYITLCWLRSPRPNGNWLISLLSVMDAAALQLSLTPAQVSALDARLALRSGFSCMNQVAAAIGLPAIEDPDPDGPIELTYEDFLQAVEMLRSVGYPVEVDPAQAWPHFRGWRVNYEPVAYALASNIDAPPAYWSGPRRWAASPIPPKRPANRISTETREDDPQHARRRSPLPPPVPKA